MPNAAKHASVEISITRHWTNGIKVVTLAFDSLEPGSPLHQPLPRTEQRDPAATDFGGDDTAGSVALLFGGQRRAVAAVEAALGPLEAAVVLAAERLEAGGRLVYLAAGSPALIALADALEIPQTFGEPAERFLTILAGGLDLVRDFAGGFEDDEAAARQAVAEAAIGPLDCVVAVSASGSTPFVRAGLGAAREAGAATVAIANNPGAPILAAADVAVLLDTGPETLAGSTRMGAGTAQKIALNILSTALAARRGHVHAGHMVSLRPDNDKLRARARRMIRDITGVDEREARQALERSGGDVRAAILLLRGASDLAEARALLGQAGSLPAALAALAA